MEHKTLSAVQDALKSAPIGILLLDAKGNIQWYNDTLPEILDIQKEQLAKKSLNDIDDELRSILIDPPETILHQNDEHQRWLRCNRQMLDDQSEVHFYVDISTEQQLRIERDQLAEDLQQLTTRDPITGLPNRRALLQGLEPLVSRSRRYGNPLSIVKLNIGITDDTPEEAQTAAWMQVAQLLKDQMRWADIIGRYDGPDFLLILPETPQEAAERLCQKLCQIIDEKSFSSAGGRNIEVTPYCGVTSWTKGDDATLMLQRVSDEVNAARAA